MIQKIRDLIARHGRLPVDIATLTPVPSAPTPLRGPRRVSAGYAELLVPLFGGSATLPGVHLLVFGVLLVVVIRFAPDGLVGAFGRARQAWRFRHGAVRGATR